MIRQVVIDEFFENQPKRLFEKELRKYDFPTVKFRKNTCKNRVEPREILLDKGVFAKERNLGPVWFDFDEFLSKNNGEFYYLTRYGTKSYSEIDFSNVDKNIYLIFGKESTGIPKELLHDNLDKCYRIPTSDNVRALNLSNCVAIVTYEVLRQQGFPNLLFSDPFKGNDYLK